LNSFFNGFFSDDIRSIQEIIQADQQTLNRLGVDQYQIADRLQYFVDQGKMGLETEVGLGDYIVQINWSRGKLMCPFGVPGSHEKMVIRIYNK
jgi:hypothetical protein